MVKLTNKDYLTMENRQAIFDSYKGAKNKNMRRMFLDYNRYFECISIIDFMEKNLGINIRNLKVLDFGCGVGDYAIGFARCGAVVDFEDIDEDCLAFLTWRLDREKYPYKLIEDPDVVIFGEVLDHLEDPLGKIKEFVEGNTKFIFTSSYPYRSDSPNNEHWRHDHHPEAARLQQPEVRNLLEQNFKSVKVTGSGEARLWYRNI